MEDIVTFEIAKKLKEKGFREECLAYYNDDSIEYNHESKIFNCELFISHNSYDNIWHRDYIDAPTISQVLKWLLDKKKIFLTVDIESRGFFYIVNYDILTNLEEEHEFQIFTPNGCYRTPQEAYESGIEHILDNMV